MTFSDLVEEAFIKPIRSVLIIDDMYPTWEQIFSDKGYDPAEKQGVKSKWAERAHILEVVQQFRKVSPAMLVDIHNGQQNEGLGDYLHQSDLLILDYQLEEGTNPGQRAKEIVNDLQENSHFNQIVIHTATEILREPFYDVLGSLFAPIGIRTKTQKDGKELVSKFEEDEQNEEMEVEKEIKDSVRDAIYFAYRQSLIDGDTPESFIAHSPELTRFKDLAGTAGWDTDSQKLVFDWALAEYEKEASISGVDRAPTWNSEGPLWIRTKGAFIAFASKKDKNLLKVLKEALEDWKPTPSRLLSAKMRTDLNSIGAIAENEALSDRLAYWHYYQELSHTRTDSSEIEASGRTLLEGHAARHIERLFDLIGEKTIDFGLKILKSDPCSEDAGYDKHYRITDEEKKTSHLNYNAFVSTKPVSGWHLQPGHIFKLEEAHWVCASPSCDLVPGQKGTSAVCGSLEASIKPFLAVQLSERVFSSKKADAEKLKKETNANTLIFLKEDDGSIKTFTFHGSDGKAPPVWRLFLASDFGRISLSGADAATLTLSFLRSQKEQQADEGEMTLGDTAAPRMTLVEMDGQIVGQLRYEYALNLIQKLGVEFTRVGLEYLLPVVDDR